jgi:oligoribonuclease NrnB/cAMP/cGMP phosphodiesterase (DHH superfamily)
LDGVGCGILIKKFLKNVSTLYLNYNEVDEALIQESGNFDSVIITDVSPSKRAYGRVQGETDITFIDHHPTSEWLKDEHGVVHDTSRSATVLTYEWLKEQGHKVEPYADFADCVNDFDMWHMRREGSLQMNILFMKLGIDRFEKRFLTNPDTVFDETERMIVTLEEDRRDRYIRNASQSGFEFTDSRGLRGYAVFCEEYNSEVGNHITGDLGVDYVVIVNAQKKKVSLRSIREVDVSEIAVRNGGGGHKNAAGFSIDFDFGMEKLLYVMGLFDER